MKKANPFARFTHLLKAIEELPIPMSLYNRHRMEYDYILGQISISFCISGKREVSIGELTSCAILGSQPTASKRVQELIQFGLIEAGNGDDHRQKILFLTVAGEHYLQTCSELMQTVLSTSEVSPGLLASSDEKQS